MAKVYAELVRKGLRTIEQVRQVSKKLADEVEWILSMEDAKTADEK